MEDFKGAFICFHSFSGDADSMFRIAQIVLTDMANFYTFYAKEK